MKTLSAILVLAAALAAQPTWLPLTPTTVPTPLTGHQLAYDGIGSLLFGGNANNVYVDETWRFDGSDWTRLFPASSPSARRRHAMTYDPLRGRIVLFGGQDNTQTDLADTWEWDGVAWTSVTLASAPAPRRDHAMAYDPNLGKVILFGGRSAAGTLGDLWTFDGVQWQALLLSPLPSPRWDHQMVLDEARGNIVLFGGGSAGNAALNDTWIFDGVAFSQAAPPVSPVSRWTPALTYDPGIGRVLMFGGYNTEQYLDETWTFDGTTWEARPTPITPPARGGPQAVHNPLLGRTFLFGGWFPGPIYRSDTFEFLPRRRWQTNQAPAVELTLDGKNNEAFDGPIAVTVPLMGSAQVAFSSGVPIAGWELVVTPGPAVPGLGGGGLTLPDGQFVNLPVTGGFFTLNNGLSAQIPVFPTPLVLTATAPGQASAQLAVLDGNLPLGFSLSAAAQYTIADAVYLENMDSVPLGVGNYPIGWSDGGGTGAWQPTAGWTRTGGTGPLGDHTSDGRGRYLYAEANGNNGGTFVVDTGVLATAGLTLPHADFWYQLSGGAAGTLFLEEFDGALWNVVFQVSGSQGAAWVSAHVPLTPVGGTASLRFRYVAGAGNQGDCALDDFALAH